MARNIKAHRGEFRRQHFVLGPFFEVRQGFFGGAPAAAEAPPKSPCWPLVFSRWRRCALSMARSITANICERRAPSESIAPDLIRLSRTRLFKQARVDVIAELVDRVEAPEFGAGIENSLHRVFADILDRAQAETNRFAHRSEIESARIHVGRKDRDAHAARFVDVLHYFLGVARFRSEQRGHELDRIMRFQIRGLVGQQSVGAGVRFIEAVSRRIPPSDRKSFRPFSAGTFRAAHPARNFSRCAAISA